LRIEAKESTIRIVPLLKSPRCSETIPVGSVITYDRDTIVKLEEKI
jgi:hypothetical protein